jgi:hypothetical protein
VHLAFDAHGVVGEEQGVDVGAEGHGRIAELAYAIQRIEATRHPDLHHALAEGTEVRDDIHVAGADVRCPVVDLFDRLVDVGQLLA